MKKILLAAVLITAVPAFGFAADMQGVLEGHSLYRLQVSGLVCPYCVYNVEQKLQDISGVEYVDVDLDTGRVMVGLKPDYHLEAKQVQTLIEEAGFRLEGMERRPMTREELEGTE